RRRLLLSNAAVQPAERSSVLIALIVSIVMLAALAPFATVMLPAVPAFIPAYETALLIIDLIAAVLMFGQFAQLRTAPVLVLACGYLFDALMTMAHALTFPGLFAPGGWLWAGTQSTAWIYMIWHGGFALFVLGYAVLQYRAEGVAGALTGRHALIAIAAAIGLADALILLVTVGHDWMPVLLQDGNYTRVYIVTVTTVWVVSFAAAAAVWRRRDRSALDLWLVVVMVAWLADIALSAGLNRARWDVGFYFGRGYGLVAASFVVAMILLETSGLHSRLARATVRLEKRASRLEAEHHNTEAQLRQAQKMEALGNLTGGMAHDFNNLLGALILNLETLETMVEPGSEAAEVVELSLEATLHGAELTRHLLAFARRQPLQPRRVELNALIGELAKFLGRALGEHITVSLDPAADLWPVIADPSQVGSALTNLANNARDAMPNGGKLMIETGNRIIDADYAAQHQELSPGEYAMIQVTDTGTGMSPETLARVFEPFFTTKEVGKGSGLGLAMVFGFMKQSGGHINVYSELGVGTTFRLYLPRATEEPDAPEAEKTPPLPTGSGETILAVEDNAGLRRVAVRQLKELGYRVIEADTAAAALAILEAETVALVLTDVVMPGGMSGVALAKIVAERWPSTRIVLTSGFPEAGFGEADNIGDFGRLLSKPYRRADLAKAIKDALGA
ncbi:MAG TPA: MASE4 domain-containing protein, partial [Stellaceae bacterium]|nr:MASE4 domain-containing protein [Stellaceae bacterium]